MYGLGVIWDEIKAKEEDEARAERHLWRLNFDGRVSKGLAALRRGLFRPP